MRVGAPFVALSCVLLLGVVLRYAVLVCVGLRYVLLRLPHSVADRGIGEQLSCCNCCLGFVAMLGEPRTIVVWVMYAPTVVWQENSWR